MKADARFELLQKRDKRVTNMYTHKRGHILRRTLSTDDEARLLGLQNPKYND